MQRIMEQKSLRSLRLGTALATLGALAACGGGSGDGSTPTGTAPTTGTVAILFTDGPTDEFCQVLARVESIDLLGTNGPTNVFTGPETIDVLAMRNFTDVFSIDTEVPVGSYEKIRLTLSDLALVECDPETMVPEPSEGWEHPKLPGNGKLDLNPRGSFQIVGGETVMIQIDMDMDKSLHAHQTGNGRWQFRPVIFVDIKPNETKLVRVFGQVRDLNGTNFELCPTEPASSMDDDDNGMNGDMGGDDDSGRCIDVVAGGAGIFNGSGDPVGTDAFTNGDLLTAIGFLGMHDDDDDGDSNEDDLKLDAGVIELGDQGSFDRPIGAVASTPGNDGLFLFDPADGTYALDPVTTKFQAGTRIFALGSNAELTTAALQPGTSGQVDGVLTDPVAVPPVGPLKSALIVLDEDTTPVDSLPDATVKSIVPLGAGADPLVREFSVDYGAITGKCVKTDSATKYLLITESATSVAVEPKTFDTLVAVNDVVDIYGSEEAGCVLADSIQEYVTAP